MPSFYFKTPQKRFRSKITPGNAQKNVSVLRQIQLKLFVLLRRERVGTFFASITVNFSKNIVLPQ